MDIVPRKKANHVVIIISFFVCLMILFLCPSFPTGGGYFDSAHYSDHSLYEIEAVFSPLTKELTCKQTIEYINTEGSPLYDIYLHLYPNAFKNEGRSVFPKEEINEAYPKGFSPGYIEIDRLLLNDEPVPFSLNGYGEDILKISLSEALNPGEATKIYMEYSLTIPNSPGRFGYFDNTFNLGNWYPILCVYDEGGWNLEPYYPIGDPFYSDVSNYRVKIIAPSDYVVAATGDFSKPYEMGDYNVWEFEGIKVRDFAWVASNKFRVTYANVGDTLICSYFYSQGKGNKALDYGVHALGVFNELFGVYPYERLSIVQTDFFIGGMEYPQLVMIDGSLYEEDGEDWLELVIVHEIAHQWWYGLVGNDEINDSWLDEALTEYSTLLYYGQRYGPDKEKEKYRDIFLKGNSILFGIYEIEGDINNSIHRPLYDFKGWMEYDSLVYGRGAIMFHKLRQEMGNENFLKVLKYYFKKNKYQNAKPHDLFKACEKVTGRSWVDFFSEWLYDEHPEKKTQTGCRLVFN